MNDIARAEHRRELRVEYDYERWAGLDHEDEQDPAGSYFEGDAPETDEDYDRFRAGSE